MATASRNPSNSLDERLFPPIQMLERPVAERPQHDTLEGIMVGLRVRRSRSAFLL